MTLLEPSCLEVAPDTHIMQRVMQMLQSYSLVHLGNMYERNWSWMISPTKFCSRREITIRLDRESNEYFKRISEQVGIPY